MLCQGRGTNSPHGISAGRCTFSAFTRGLRNRVLLDMAAVFLGLATHPFHQTPSRTFGASCVALIKLQRAEKGKTPPTRFEPVPPPPTRHELFRVGSVGFVVVSRAVK
jgi:hypothetical protein